MTIEEVRKRITEILNKEDADGSQGVSTSSGAEDNQVKNDENVIQVRDNNGNQVHKIDDYHNTFGGSIFNGYVINGREMTRKEYLTYSKNLKQDELLKHPLLYLMFRAEGQGEANFFDWLSKFKK